MATARSVAIIEAEAARQAKLEPVIRDCRRFSLQLWRENPNLTVDEILECHEIKEIACNGFVYKDEEMLHWILPEFTPHQELENFYNYPSWKLEEAVALWYDLSPFVVSQAENGGNPAFWQAAYHPNFRERYTLLLEKARRCAISGQLPATELKGQYWIAPKDFYTWAIKNAEPPDATRILDFFAKLNESWSSNHPNKKESKVESKLKEIGRILAAVKAVDPEFDATSMPGRKQDFHNLCMQLNKSMFSIAHATFNDYLLGICSFNAGARATDYYSSIAAKLE
jgi:hypothetical protein